MARIPNPANNRKIGINIIKLYLKKKLNRSATAFYTMLLSYYSFYFQIYFFLILKIEGNLVHLVRFLLGISVNHLSILRGNRYYVEQSVV